MIKVNDDVTSYLKTYFALIDFCLKKVFASLTPTADAFTVLSDKRIRNINLLNRDMSSSRPTITLATDAPYFISKPYEVILMYS